jgi:hypothetical protein
MDCQACGSPMEIKLAFVTPEPEQPAPDEEA